jgi:formylglycine-generating enzyme required for sulfatase activity
MGWWGWLAAAAAPPAEIAADNERVLAEHAAVHGLTAEQRARLDAIFAASDRMGRGLPTITKHPMTEEQCASGLAGVGVTWRDEAAEKICGGPYLRPVFDPATQRAEDATTCVDVFEWPNLPCRYPVVWVRAAEAAEICEAEGKRLCDAHEWEGACAGSLLPPDYPFEAVRGLAPADAQARMRRLHNDTWDNTKAWSYGPGWENGRCAAASTKSPDCDGSDWRKCGSNTYPTGAFPRCTSAFGVADLHGNAAEHMNLPLAAEQLSSAKGGLGVTEMKGSWFIWDTYAAHEDWCRWRAPYWHGGPIEADDSHRNYHLGFRCCKSLPE